MCVALFGNHPGAVRSVRRIANILLTRLEYLPHKEGLHGLKPICLLCSRSVIPSMAAKRKTP